MLCFDRSNQREKYNHQSWHGAKENITCVKCQTRSLNYSLCAYHHWVKKLASCYCPCWNFMNFTGITLTCVSPPLAHPLYQLREENRGGWALLQWLVGRPTPFVINQSIQSTTWSKISPVFATHFFNCEGKGFTGEVRAPTSMSRRCALPTCITHVMQSDLQYFAIFQECVQLKRWFNNRMPFGLWRCVKQMREGGWGGGASDHPPILPTTAHVCSTSGIHWLH